MQGFAAPPPATVHATHSPSPTPSSGTQASHGSPQRRWSRKKVRLPDDPEPRLLVYGSGSGVCYFSCRPRKPNCPPLIRWQDLAVTRQTRCHLAALHLHPLRHGRFAHQPGFGSVRDLGTPGSRYARLSCAMANGQFSRSGFWRSRGKARSAHSLPLAKPPSHPFPCKVYGPASFALATRTSICTSSRPRR